jgi:hypothetical protein
MAAACAAGICLSAAVQAAAANSQNSTLEARAAGAERVVVAVVRGIASEWRQTDRGDRLIVSRIELEVSENLKGPASRAVWFEMEGGTLDGLTLQVSSLPQLASGERAVFFLDSAARGVLVPHLRGQGILALDEADRVRGTNLGLDELRARVRAVTQ